MSNVKYQPYKTWVNTRLVKLCREYELIPQKGIPSFWDVTKAYNSMAAMMGKPFGVELLDFVMLNEAKFQQSDKYTLFPSSKEILNTVLRSKLNIADFNSIKPLSSSFVVMIPQGYKTPHGIPLTSFLVQWEDSNQLIKEYEEIIPTLGAIKGVEFGIDGHGRLLDVVALSKSGEAIRYSGYDSSIYSAIKDIDNSDEFEKSVDILSGEQDEIEKQQCAAMVKLAVGLSVFNSAYDNFIVEGLPNDSKLKKVGDTELNKAAVFGLESQYVSPNTPKSGHVRCFHFRQLMHPKFYQGKHSNQELGTRWVAVSESWIGESISGHTTNDDIGIA